MTRSSIAGGRAVPRDDPRARGVRHSRCAPASSSGSASPRPPCRETVERLEREGYLTLDDAARPAPDRDAAAATRPRCCAGTGSPSGCSSTCSRCRGTRCTRRPAGSSTRSATTSSRTWSSCSATRAPARTATRSRARPTSSTPARQVPLDRAHARRSRRRTPHRRAPADAAGHMRELEQAAAARPDGDRRRRGRRRACVRRRDGGERTLPADVADRGLRHAPEPPATRRPPTATTARRTAQRVVARHRDDVSAPGGQLGRPAERVALALHDEDRARRPARARPARRLRPAAAAGAAERPGRGRRAAPGSRAVRQATRAPLLRPPITSGPGWRWPQRGRRPPARRRRAPAPGPAPAGRAPGRAARPARRPSPASPAPRVDGEQVRRLDPAAGAVPEHDQARAPAPAGPGARRAGPEGVPTSSVVIR